MFLSAVSQRVHCPSSAHKELPPSLIDTWHDLSFPVQSQVTETLTSILLSILKMRQANPEPAFLRARMCAQWVLGAGLLRQRRGAVLEVCPTCAAAAAETPLSAVSAVHGECPSVP